MISDVIASRPTGAESNNKSIGQQGLDDTGKASYAEFTNDRALEDRQKMISAKSEDKTDSSDESSFDSTATVTGDKKPVSTSVKDADSTQGDLQSNKGNKTQENIEGNELIIGLNSLQSKIQSGPQNYIAMQYSNGTIQGPNSINSIVSKTNDATFEPARFETLTYGELLPEALIQQGTVSSINQDISHITPVLGLTTNSDQSSAMASPLAATVIGGLNLTTVSLNAISQAVNSRSGNLAAVMSGTVASSSDMLTSVSSPVVNFEAMNTTAILTNDTVSIKRAENAWQPFNNILAAGAIGQMGLDVKTADMADVNSQLYSQQLVRGANPSVSQWGPVPVNTLGSLTQQAQDMLTPLREQLRFQIDQHIKHAEIRLDPPELGKLELNIRLDGDKLHVQMHAANPATRDALLSGLERLRADLAQEYGGTLDVDVSSGDSEQPKQRDQSRSTAIAMNQVEGTTALNNSLNSSQQSQLNLLA
ncbi:flagellar hook-length control protein FliK [Shewanella polaris]|uniref:Flagellar hook-length control protein-like C-terminal domain-containing protein n=1 Tax=Shewanella polaris TaxID=2588449 RepID=A0A4Y5YC48_9GAMM|nr:flagellar hook-length control protein FliK [Shewanella polaris]QDE30302.1 hypothetical protein FH971_04540 [Shewanella polaris]